MTTKTKKTPSRKPNLDLHVPQDPDGSVAAVMPLAWCFFEKSMVRDNLAKRGFQRPHLLITIRQRREISYPYFDDPVVEWSDSKAFVVPLTQGLQYVSFNRPGENQVLVHIIDIPNSDRMKLVRAHVHETNAGYYNGSSAFSDTGEKLPLVSSFRLENISFFDPQGDTLTVHVPSEMFAPEPAAWRKRLVGRFFSSSRVVDQCHFRKRFFFVALPLSLPFLFFATVLKLLYLLVGIPVLAPRRLAWKTFLDPWAGPINIVDKSPDANSWFFQEPLNKHGQSYWRVGWQSLLSPIVLLGPASLAYGITHISIHYTGSKTHTHPWWTHAPRYWKFVLYFDLWVVAIIGVVIGLSYIITFAMRALGLAGARAGESKSARRDRERLVERERLIRELELMTCGTAPPPMSVADLPKDKQTVYLKFTDFKTKVCKPFAR